MTEPSTLYRLVDTALAPHGGLAAYVARRRADGWSWRSIAADLPTVGGVAVSYETLRTWYAGTDQDVTP